MENVKSLEMYIKEAFEADVTTSEKSNDVLDIELPGSNEKKKFKLLNGKPVQIITDENGKESISEIDDDSMKDFVKKAIRGIKNIKEQDRALEIERISGNIPEIVDDVEIAYDSQLIRVNNSKTDEMYSLWELIKDLKDYEYKYIKFNSEDFTDKQKEWFGKFTKMVGKGEYFLPLIYPDVYKNTKKGDNHIKTPEGNIYQIEVKTNGSPFNFGKFQKGISDFNKKKIDDWKKITVGSLTNYLLCRNLDEDLYLIIFDNDKKDVYGFFVFKVGKTMKSYNDMSNTPEYKALYDALYSISSMSDFPVSDTADFICEYSKDSNNILIHLNTKYLPQQHHIQNKENILKLKKKGYTEKEIAQELNYDIKDVLNVIKQDTIDKKMHKSSKYIIYDREQIFDLKSQGYTTKEIADKLNYDYKAVHSFITREELKNDNSNNDFDKDKIIELIDKGLSLKQIAQELHYKSYNKLSQFCKEQGISSKASQKYDNEAIIELRNLGLTIKKIADILNYDYIRLLKYCSRENIRFQQLNIKKRNDIDGLIDIILKIHNSTDEKEKDELRKELSDIKNEKDIHKERIFMTSEIKSKILDLYRKGFGPSYIAKEVGEDAQRIKDFIKNKKRSGDDTLRRIKKTNESFHIKTFDEMFNN